MFGKSILKRLAAFLIMMFVFCSTVTAADTALLGDVNADGKITSYDARLTLRYASRLDDYNEMQFCAADVDASGKITAYDARLILRVAAHLDEFEQTSYVAATTETTAVNSETFAEPETKESASLAVTTTEADDSRSDTVYITPTGKKYHLSTCRTIKSACSPVSRSDAVAQGYDACKICKP